MEQAELLRVSVEALRKIESDPTRSEADRAFARQSLEHIEAGHIAFFGFNTNPPIEQRSPSEFARVEWFVCKNCGLRAGIAHTADGSVGAIHDRPSCQLFKDLPALEFRQLHAELLR